MLRSGSAKIVFTIVTGLLVLTFFLVLSSQVNAQGSSCSSVWYSPGTCGGCGEAVCCRRDRYCVSWDQYGNTSDDVSQRCESCSRNANARFIQAMSREDTNGDGTPDSWVSWKGSQSSSPVTGSNWSGSGLDAEGYINSFRPYSQEPAVGFDKERNRIDPGMFVGYDPADLDGVWEATWAPQVCINGWPAARSWQGNYPADARLQCVGTPYEQSSSETINCTDGTELPQPDGCSFTIPLDGPTSQIPGMWTSFYDYNATHEYGLIPGVDLRVDGVGGYGVPHFGRWTLASLTEEDASPEMRLDPPDGYECQRVVTVEYDLNDSDDTGEDGEKQALDCTLGGSPEDDNAEDCDFYPDGSCRADPEVERNTAFTTFFMERINPATERIVGRIRRDGSGTYHRTRADGTEYRIRGYLHDRSTPAGSDIAGWTTDPDNVPYFYIGRWSVGTNASIELENPDPGRVCSWIWGTYTGDSGPGGVPDGEVNSYDFSQYRTGTTCTATIPVLPPVVAAGGSDYSHQVFFTLTPPNTPTPTFPEPPRCGDGITNGTDQCDEGDTSAAWSVPTDQCFGVNEGFGQCTFTFCGDGFRQLPNGRGTGGLGNSGQEQCDDTSDACYMGASNPAIPVYPCMTSFCGDGIRQVQNGAGTGGTNDTGDEECDQGTANGTGGLCNTDCTVNTAFSNLCPL
ncbi:hypothetical protein HY469_00250 [Candidatus Roizmanbacteria bacterium]|nr:hypothetical protein [Candidatus Roizmanbacteria bacterium]